MITDVHELEQKEYCTQSQKWIQNTCGSAEGIMVLELIQAIVKNAKQLDQGSIKIHVDCEKVWEMLTEDLLKASCYAGDGGSFISKIRELENETKVDLQYVHIKTSESTDEIMTREKRLIKNCHRRSNEVRKKCKIENRAEKINVKGNM